MDCWLRRVRVVLWELHACMYTKDIHTHRHIYISYRLQPDSLHKATERW